jgi:S-formylglutathione hydrolase FrmB
VKLSHYILCLQFLLPVFIKAAEIQFVTIPSQCMNRSIMAAVILPHEYAQTNKKYSAIYCLHGFRGNHTSWIRMAPIDSFAEEFKIIFICPDGFNSWYVNSPMDSSLLFESFITGELISFIDKHYRTITLPGGRAIIGSSMGGYGAITLCAKHPDLYCGAGSISGIMDLSEFPREWHLAHVFGEYLRHQELWKEFAAIHVVGLLINKGKTLRIECGDRDFALTGNRTIHARLNELGIRHVYQEGPGMHDARFVRRVARDHILFFKKRFGAMPP